jgi:pSer/pThr/pTyr-binding forkhead associated (FHA) protein
VKVTSHYASVFITLPDVTLGRAGGAHVADPTHIAVSTSKRVSRKHARISYDQLKGFLISCLSDKSPVYVNDSVLRIGDPPSVLQNGSCIVLGDTLVSFQISHSTQEQQLPPDTAAALTASQLFNSQLASEFAATALRCSERKALTMDGIFRAVESLIMMNPALRGVLSTASWKDVLLNVIVHQPTRFIPVRAPPPSNVIIYTLRPEESSSS